MPMTTLRHPDFTNVLLAADLSPATARAVPYIRALQETFAASVPVVYVLDPFPYHRRRDPEAAERVAQLRRQAESRLRLFLSRHGFDSHRAQYAVLEGDVVAAVEKAVARGRTDLIVLCTAGRVRGSRLFFGSIAEEVFR